ncbi:MAG TPA: universal stress protein [Rubricoccaceae bacterium]|jgi:nucleotide-binding universal stress UspA family protein
MLQIRTVLVPTDRSPCAEKAYAPAVALAARHGAALRVVHVSKAGGRLQDDVYLTADDVAHDLRLSSEPGSAGRPPVFEEVTALHASPALDILAHARAHDVDVIVMGTHGRLGSGHFLLGSVTEHVVRLADRPVLTVPCDPLHEGGPVVAAVDFSEGSATALLYAKELAAERGAALHALHVVEWAVDPQPYLYGLEVPALADVLARARVELAAFVAAAGPDVVPVVRARVGGLAAFAVADYAREVEAGLVVISTHGRTGLSRMLLGSVAERVVRTAPCPVLTVHPDGRGLLPLAGDGAVLAVEPPVPGDR